MRATYYEGLPEDAASRIGPAGGARLVEMLSDPDERAHHQNVLLALGMSGTPGAFEAIRAWAGMPESGEIDRAAFRAWQSLPFALGHLARHDRRALGALENRLNDPGAPGWTFRHHRGARLANQSRRAAATSLGPHRSPWRPTGARARRVAWIEPGLLETRPGIPAPPRAPRGRVEPMKGRSLLLSALLLTLAGPTSAAPPDVDLHDLTWYVHIDLIDAGAGEDLAYWQGVIDEAVAEANVLLEGGQGPFDTPCCTRMDRSVSVATFGTTGDGLDVIDSVADENAIAAFSSTGSTAFLVDSGTYCGGSSPGAIGCATQPFCDGNGNDDPDLWMWVTVESFDDDTLGAVIGHERGHNSCLPHVAAAECQLMRSTVFTPGQAGCLSTSECNNFGNARTTTSSGLDCDCHDGLGGLVADGSSCTEVTGGLCSGGVCGDPMGDAATQLMASGDAAGGAPEDALLISALPGEWSSLGQITPGADDVEGLAYATDSDTLYGVIPTSGNDSIVTLNATTGALISTVGSIANGSEEIISMAYDPGATTGSGDDRLLVMEVNGTSGEIRAIDPASPSSTTLVGAILWSSADLFTGLAYDSTRDKLYAATPFFGGLFEIDLTTCPPSPCSSAPVSGIDLFRDDASLSYSADTDRLYLVGDAFSGARTFYDAIDPVTIDSERTLSLDVFSTGGLAAVPLPEPHAGAGVALGLVAVSLLAHRRRSH